MDSDQPATTQSGEMVLAKFDNHPGEENMEMEVGQQMEEQVLGYLEVQPSQLQAVQEGGTIYFQSDGLELDEQLILAQGGEGGEIIVVVRTDQDGLGFTGEGGESALRAVKFGDLAGLAQQMGLAPGTKISLQSDDKDDESGTTYLTYETTGEEYGHEMQENLQTSEIGIPDSEGNETITLSLSDNTVNVLSVGDENATKDVYLQEHGELTEVPVSVSEDGIRIIEKPYDNTNSCNEENIMHIVDNVSEDNIRENNGNQCYITVGVNGNEINTIENYNPTLAQVAEQERLINSPAKHPIVVHLSRDTNQSVHHESQATSTEILQEQNNFHTSNAEDQFLEKKECEMYQTTIVTSEDGQQQLEYHIVQSSEIGDGSQGHASISEADCYGQWSAMETSGQELSNEMTIVENSAEENIAVVSQQSGVETNSIDSVSNNKITSITEPPVNETLRSIEEFLRTGETEEHPTNESDSVPTEAKTESTEVVETESKQEAIIIETNEEGLPTEISLESDSQDMSGMIMEEMPQNTTSYVVINLDSPSQFTNAMGNSIQMESVNFKSVVNEHGQSVGILETANGDLEVILDSESLVPSTNSTFSKENHDEDEISVISNHSSSMQEVLNPQIHKAFQKLLSTPEKKSTSLSEPTTYQVNLASAKTKVNSKHQSVSDGPKRGDKTSKAAKETLKEKKMTIFDIGGASEDLTVKIPTRQYSRTYSRKKTTPVPAATTSKEIPPIVDVQESEFGRNEIILVIEPNDSPSNDYDKLEIGNNENSTQDVIGLSSNAGTPKERKTVSILNVSKETSDENKIEIDTTKSPIKETSLAVENQVSNVEEMEVDNAIMVMAKSEKDKVAEDGKITEQNDIQTSTVSDNTAEQSEGNIELPNEIDSELFFELPQTAPISTSHEISTDLEGTVNEEENQPLTEEENQPLTEEENQPLTEVENQPLTEEENQPLTEVENQPLTEEENQPLIEEEHQSMIEVDNQSMIEEENQSMIEEENQSMIEEENQSMIEEENQSMIEEENQSMIEEENQSVIEVENQSVIEVENQSVIEVENQSVIEVENQSVIEVENQSMIEEENQPLVDVENQPLIEEENQSLIEEENQSLIEEENQSLIEEENQSLIEEENQSLIEEENQSLIEEENQSLIEEENQSLIEVENQALIEEENQPSINSIEIAEETTFKNSHDLSEFHEYKVVTSTKTDSAGLEIFGVPHEASTEPQEAASVPQKHLVAPQEAVAVPQETVAVPLEAVAIPQESVSVPQDILNVQEDQANPDSSEPQDTVSLPQEDVSIPLEAASVPGDVLPVTQDLDNLSQNEELIELKSMPVPDESQDDDLLSESQGVDTLSESTGMVFKDSTVTTGQDQVALEKEFIEIAKKSSPVAKKSLPIVKDKVAIAKKSLVVKKTGKKYEKEKVFVDSENDKAETDNDKESEVEKMDMENDIRDSSFRAEKLASADEENSHYGFDQDESMNDKDNDEIMKESIILDDSQLDSIQIGANENELKQKRGRKRQVDEQLDKDGKRVKPNQQKDSTATSLSVIKEKNIKRKLFNESATGKKLGRPKKSSTGNKAYQSQDELFDELLKDTLPNASKKRKSDVKDYSRKPNTASGEAKRRRTLPPRLPNDFASSDEDDVVLSNLYSYPGKKYKSLSQGKRGRGRGKTGRPKIFKNQGSSDEEEVMMSNLRIYPEFKEQRPGFGESSKRGRGRSRIAKNVSSNSNRYDIDSQEPLSKSEPNKRGRGRPRGALIRRKARSMSAKKQAKDFKIHFCYQQSNPEKQHQIYSCKECHFRTSRLANIIWHYKECSLDLFPFKSSSVGERTPTRFKLDGGTSSKSLPENRFPNRKLDAPKKISPSKSDRSSKSNRNKRAEDGTGLRDDNSLGTDDRESSDFTCESDEEDTYDIEMKNTFGFAENDVVWAEWRNQHWPALVRKIYPRQKKVSVFFIATPMPSKGFTMNVRKVTNFDDAAKNKDFLEKGFSLQKTDQLVKSVQLAEEYLRKKCLGLKISALQFFNNPEAAKQILSELEESAENQGSDLSDSAMNDPPTPVAIIDLDRLTNPAQEEMSELVDETDLQTNKDDDALEAEKLIKCIQEGNCNEHLIQVYNGDVNSERHRLFSSGLEVDRGCVRRASVYKGVVTDEGKKVELTHYCVEFFKKKLVCVEGFNIVAYAYEVMVPEAILKAISLLNKISLTEAEAIFGKNDIDKTQSVFTTVRESEGQVICVVLEKSDEKLMETGENDKDENISNPDSSSTCPKSQTELPT